MKGLPGLLSLFRQSLFVAFAAAALAAPTVMAVPAGASSERACETGACGRCGDGYCSKRCGETAANCPKDCGVVSE